MKITELFDLISFLLVVATGCLVFGTIFYVLIAIHLY